MLVLIGLVASGARELAATGETARVCLGVVAIVMAVAIGLLAIALTLRTIDTEKPDYAGQVRKANKRILGWIRAGTLFLALGVALTTIALVSAFY